MKITRRTDYAIHLLAELSEQPDCCLGLRALSEKHGVTYAFARTVQQGLLKAGLISACRGINGGIKLARPLEEITVLEVFEAAQGPLDTTFSTDSMPWCGCTEACMSDKVWSSAKRMISDHFSSLTMHNLLKSKSSKAKAKAKR
jgi:Rrf2 family protein